MLYATVARTELAGIQANLEAIRARVGDRKVLAAVKANGYGHGAVVVARMCQETGAADWLGVATVPEALELRDAGITLPILKFSHAVGDEELAACVARDVTLAVVDAVGIEAVQEVAARLGRLAAVHLKLDTGMRRIGAEPSQAVELAQQVDAAPNLVLEGVFSHLPISDTPGGKDYTRDQIARFRAVAEAVESARGKVPLVHLANSGAILQHRDAWFDLVRPGVMVYGNYPAPQCEKSVPLRPALRWTTRVSFVKKILAGETVGYARTWTAPRDTWIATIPVGYGDGYSRLLSNRGRILIKGASYPIAGRVCMDQTMIDLGPETVVAPGDEVVLIGASGDETITVEEVAQLMGTITYEVTCLIGGRVQRTTDRD